MDDELNVDDALLTDATDEVDVDADPIEVDLEDEEVDDTWSSEE
ncbi:MAG TPA: hypothetical protein VEC13_01510 [Candidatus Paceibacterota bacterium]|nr:hypothetical protein [Candidatus Paceibacterota bacterium]